MALLEEPKLFLCCIKDVYLEGCRYTPMESDAQIRSQIEHSKQLSAASGSIERSTELAIRQDNVVETRYLLAFSPLTQLVLQKCTIDQDGSDALTLVIQRCSTLKTIEMAYCTKKSTNFTPMLLAISESTSIRYLTFDYDGRNLDCREIDSVIHLIQSSRTLQRLQLNDVFCSTSQMCRALKALRTNTSIWEFKGLASLQYPAWLEPSEMEVATLNKLLLELISNTKTLVDVRIRFGFQESYQILSESVFLEAFDNNINLWFMSLEEQMYDYGAVAVKPTPEIHYSNDLAAIVFKIGRVFSGQSLVCRKRLPIELVEEIMHQVTVESVWDDSFGRRSVAL